jgi:hypothetical protein
MDVTALGQTTADVTRATLDRVVQQLPALLGAVLLVVVGWVLARIVRAVALRALLVLGVVLARVLRTGERRYLDRSAAVLATILFWIVLLVFVTAATQVLGLATFAAWLSRLLDYLPTLLAGLLIVAAGWVISRFAGDLVLATAVRLEPAQRTILARASQAAILAAAILVGADQVGVKVTFLVILVAALAVAVVGGVTLSVSLGARGYVANLIGAHSLRQGFEVGERIRVLGFEGRILEITATSLVLETDEGRVTLPGRLYHDEPILLVARRPAGG